MLTPVVFALLAFPGADAPALSAPRPPVPISGGEEAGTCDWPTVVGFSGGLCSATLIHERVILTAGHCVPGGGGRITFGESEDAAAARVRFSRCATHPDYGGPSSSGPDIGVCVLDTPVHLPIVPPLMGCEVEVLDDKPEVTLVGWGASYGEVAGSDWDWGTVSGAGVKRSIRWRVETHSATSIFIGEPGLEGGVCPGDSGGAAMVRIPGGSWRLVGPAARISGWSPESGDNDCDSALGVIYMKAHPFMAWIEEFSGYDVTPCHDADGTWNPGPECDALPMEPGVGAGDWSEGCGGGPLSGPQATCGAPIVEDLAAPDVEIVAPVAGDTFDAPAVIEISAEASDVGTGVARVGLLVDGVEAANTERSLPPFAWEATFQRGTYELAVWAEDFVGNRTESAIVGIGVGEDAPEPPEEPDDTGEDDGDTDDAGGDDDTGAHDGGNDGDPDADGSDDGCTCAASGRPRAAGALAMLVLPLLRRRGAVSRARSASRR